MWIRAVMMWLLLVALPVQSWAAATLVNCGPTHHRMGATAPNGHLHERQPQESHRHDSQASEHDHAPHHHDAVADNQGQNADQDQANSDQPPLSMGKFKCSACATCCLGMALPSPVLTFDASVSSDTVQRGMPQGHVVFLTAGLERPPRTILA